MRQPLIRALLLAGLAGATAAAFSQPAPAPTRGELLYTTHCIECHTTQMHWRDGREARDWDSLKAQVRRWQSNAGLGWTEADIVEVARHLNDTIYHYPQPSDRLGLAR
jgi:mono/diheme cytochrome c family protein